MPTPKVHLFICTNSPDKKGKCGYKNADKLRSCIKDRAKEQDWGKSVRVNSSGCLGQCEYGIAAVIYPEGKWLLNQEANEPEEIWKALTQAVTASQGKCK